MFFDIDIGIYIVPLIYNKKIDLYINYVLKFRRLKRINYIYSLA